MTFDEYIDAVVAVMKRNFLSYGTVDRFVGQFNPDEDQKLTYKAPGLLLGPITGSRITETDTPYSIRWTFGAVLARDELDRLQRDKLGWLAAEQFGIALDQASGLGNQAGVPRITQITKTNRIDANMNSGYSYWTILWEVDYRWQDVLPGEY